MEESHLAYTLTNKLTLIRTYRANPALTGAIKNPFEELSDNRKKRFEPFGRPKIASALSKRVYVPASRSRANVLSVVNRYRVVLFYCSLNSEQTL
jgi:hypothetical protein